MTPQRARRTRRIALPVATVAAIAAAMALCAAIGAFDANVTGPACAAGAARQWKACGLAAGLGIGALVYGAAAPLAGLIALAASQLAAMFC